MCEQSCRQIKLSLSMSSSFLSSYALALTSVHSSYISSLWIRIGEALPSDRKSAKPLSKLLTCCIAKSRTAKISHHSRSNAARRAVWKEFS